MKKNNEFYTKDEFLNADANQIEKDKTILSQEIANYEKHKTNGLRFYDTFTLASNNDLLKQVGYTNSEFVLDLTHFRYCTEKNAYYNLKLKDHKNTYNLNYETKNSILKGLQKDNANHFVGIDFLYKVPELLTHPIAIFAEKNHPDRQAIMLDYKHNGSYVMLAVKPNGQKMVNNINYPANFIHSIYANEKLEYKLSRQIMNEGTKFIGNTNSENNFVFYLDSKKTNDVIDEAYKKGKLRNSIYHETKKAIKVLDSENTQVSSRSSNLNGHINNIPNIDTSVNRKNEKSEEILSNLQNHQIANSVISTTSIQDQISAFRNNNFNRTDTFTLAILNPLLKEIGYTNDEITLDQTHMRYCLFNSYKGNENEKANHFTGEHFFTRLPELLSSPIAIIPSNTKGDERQLIILDYKLNGSYVCLSVRADGQGRKNDTVYPSTHILSVYAKDTAEYILHKEILNEIEHQKYVNTPCSIYYIDNKKATEMLNGKGFQLPRAFNLNGHINNIPNNERVVNRKKEKFMEKTDLNSYLNETVAGTIRENKLSELLITSTIADRLNQMGIKTYVIDDKNKQLESEVKEDKNSDLLLTLSDKKYYGFVHKDEIYLTEDGIKASVLLHEYAHLWLAVYRLSSDKNEWNKFKNDVLSSEEFNKARQNYDSDVYSTNDALFTEFVCDYIAKEAISNNALSALCNNTINSTISNVLEVNERDLNIDDKLKNLSSLCIKDLISSKDLFNDFNREKLNTFFALKTVYEISAKKEEEMRNGIKSKLTSYSDKKVNETVASIKDLVNEAKDELKTKTAKLAYKWVLDGTLILPEDKDKFKNALAVADKGHIDPFRYNSPVVLLEENIQVVLKEPPIDPDTVPTLTNKRVYDYGIVVYDVDESDESRENMRKIINTHLGKNSSPWCLLQGDENGTLTKESKTYWKYSYNKVKKQVAFINGKLSYFCASNDEEDCWWDTQDNPHDYIQVERKLPGDPLDRTGIYDYDLSSGKILDDKPNKIFRKTKNSYTTWHNDTKTIKTEQLYENKKLISAKEWDNDGKLWKYQKFNPNTGNLEEEKKYNRFCSEEERIKSHTIKNADYKLTVEYISNSNNIQKIFYNNAETNKNDEEIYTINIDRLWYSDKDKVYVRSFKDAKSYERRGFDAFVKKIPYSSGEVFYISGTIKNNPNAIQEFFTAYGNLLYHQMLAINPLEIVLSIQDLEDLTEEEQKEKITATRLEELKKAEVVISLPRNGLEDKDADLEEQVARENGIPIIPYEVLKRNNFLVVKSLLEVQKQEKLVNIDNKKATEMLNSKGFELPRGFNLNGHINNIPNINQSVNRKNEKSEEIYKNIDFTTNLNLSFDEYALTNTIATLLNKVGINTYVIAKDELANLVEQKIKATTDDETLIYKTLSDYEVYGCTKGKNIYLKEGAIKSDVLLHEYAHLWIETFRLSNPNEWDKIKTSLMNDKEVVNSLNQYSSLLSPNTNDGKLVEYICDKIAENGKNITFEKMLSEDLSTLFECDTTDELLKNISKYAIKDLVNSSPVLKNANIPENVIFFDSKDKTLFDDEDETSEEQDADNSLLDEKLKTDEYHFSPKRDEILEMLLFGSNSDATNNGDEYIVLDYSTVESDKILLANKATILDKPYPSYLPPLHYGNGAVNAREERIFKIPATELRDGNYLIRDVSIDTYIDSDGKDHYRAHDIYYKVSLEVYAALKHYNTTFFRALEEKRVNDNLRSINEAIDKENMRNLEIKFSHLQERKISNTEVDYYITYNKNVNYDTLPQIKIQSFGYLHFTSTSLFCTLTLKEYQNLISPNTYVTYETIINKEPLFYPHTASCRIANNILKEKKLIVRKDNRKMDHDTYNEIEGVTRKIYNITLDNPEIFRQWRKLQNKVSFLLNDMYYQEDNLMSSFQKGRETSYGDSNAQNTLLDDYGVLIKRQNGDEINEKETLELKNALDYTFSLYGNLSPVLKENNIKLSHAGNVNQHASSAIGIWYPLYKAIGISFKNDEQAFSTSIHEFAHFLDYMKGQKTHHWHSSTVYGTIENTIANKFRAITYPPTKYYSSTPECFARCMELYSASLKFFKNRGIDLNSIETLEYKDIEALNNYFLKENPNFNNFKITGNLHTICTKVNEVEPHISLFKVCQNFISETRELLNVDEYKAKPTIENKEIANSQNHKFTNSQISTTSIHDQISAFRNNNFSRTDTFTLATLNPLLKEVGYTNDEITLDQTHMRYCLFNSYKGNDNEKANHFTGEHFFTRLPELLSSPIAIIPSNTKGDERQLIILDYKLNGSYVCVSVRADGQGKRDFINFPSTHIFSICAKEQAEYILQCRIKEEIEHQKYVNKPLGIYYIDNKKATEMLNSKGFELPRAFNLNGHINNIPNINQSVNRKNEKSEKTFENSQNHKFTNSQISTTSIHDQISAFRNNNFSRTDTFTLATLNPLLKEIGYTNDEITLDQTHMRYCLFNSYKGNDNEKANHFTGEHFFDKLPELLSSPIAIIPSNTKGNERQLIILDYKLNGSYVCVSVRADGQGRKNNTVYASTHILSIYAKNTAEYILNKEIANEIEHQKYVNKPLGIYYIDNKKATEMLNGKGFQLPRAFNLNGHINNIPNINTSVNRKNEKSEKTFENSQNHQIADSVISSDGSPNYEIQSPVRDENINSRKTLEASAKEETMDDRNTVNTMDALSEQLKQNGINESSLLAFLRENPTLFDKIKDFSEKSEKTPENDLTGERENLNITFSNIKNKTEEHQDVSNRREDDRTLRRSNGEEGLRERVNVVKSPDDSRELPIPEIRKMPENREEGWQATTNWNSDGERGLSQHEGRADENLQLERLSDTTENDISINGGISPTDGILSSSDRSLGSETSRAGSNTSDGGEPARVSQHSRMGMVLSDGRGEHSETDLNESTSIDDANIKAKDALSIRERVKTILETKIDDEITREDRAILRLYEGVGGLKEEETTVEGALSEFYTPSSLVKKVWELVDAYAPDAYTVLEPTCGSGRFLQGRSDNLFTCYECDKTSARIAKILYPNATINNDYFQSQFLSNSKRSLRKNISQSGFGFVKNDAEKYDLVIGNPPYGDAKDMFSAFNMYKPNDTYPKYFISEGLLHLKKGGLLAFVVPSSILDGIGKDLFEFTDYCLSGQTYICRDTFSSSSTTRFWARILRNNSLVDAYRLPEGIFPSTKIGTDIIVLRHESDIDPFDIYFKDTTTDGDDGSYDTYIDRVKKVQNFFTDHHERILGEVKTRLNRARTREETYVDFKEGETKEDVFNRIVPFESERRERTREVVPPKFAIDERTGEVEKAPISQKQKTIKAPKVHSNSPLSKVMNTDDFLKKYNLNYSENDKEIWKATAYNGSIDTKNLSSDALSYLKSSDNYIEIEKGEYYLKALYVVGNIYTKLDDIEKKFGNGYIDKNRYDEVKKLLEEHLPTPLTMDKIHFSPLTEFARNFTVERDDTIYDYSNNITTSLEKKEIPLITAFYQWALNTNEDDTKYINHYSYDPATSPIRKEEFYSEKCNIIWRDVERYINREPITAGISSTDSKEKKAFKEQKALITREERKRISENLFDRFLHEGLTEQDKAKLEKEYNRIFNAVVEPDYSKIPFFVDGMSTHKGDKEFTLHPIQLRGASFLQSKGSGLLAYDVGVGKTATGIIATVAQLQSGRAKRPLIVVPKSVYNKWYEDIKQLFPNIDVNNLGNFSDNYLRPFRKGEHGLDIKEGSISLATYEFTQNLSFMDSSIENDGLLKEDLVDLLSLTGEGTARQVANEMQGLYSRYGEAIKTKNENFVFFEECGFDHITLDEAHNFKNLFAIPRKRRGESNEYEGLTGGKPSQRAVKLYCMTSLIQHQNHDRNVFLLTATPFTNHPFEVFSMISFMGRKRMKELQIGTLRDFADKFAETKSDYAVTAKGEVEFKQSMKSWRCLRELQSLLFEYIDRVTAEEAGIIRPEKIVHPVFIEMTPLQEKIRDAESERIVNSDEKAATLKAIGNNKKMSVSPCILNDEYDFDLPEMTEFVKSSPKLTVTLDTIAALYKENPTCGQVMYLDIAVDYFSLMKQYLVDKGISKDAIASIKGDTSEDRRKSICDAFNDENNPLKILIGSGAIKEGIDLNGNTIALYNISLGWNPSETVQIEGRVWRQGNAQGKVHIVYPLTEDSVDAFIYQKFEEKSKRIDALWSYKGNSLNTEDINPEEMKFNLIKDPEKKAKLFVNDEKEKLKNSLKLIELEKENYSSFKSLILREEMNKRDLEYEKARLKEAKENDSSNYYISGLKEKIKNIEKELRITEKSKEKFGLSNIQDVDRVLGEFDEKIANVNNKIATVEQQAAIKLQQYKKEFEEQRQKERKETPEITASLISAIGSNLVKMKINREPPTIETTFNESTQSYESTTSSTPSDTIAPVREAPSPKNNDNITHVIENITPVIFGDKKAEIKAEGATNFTLETMKPQEKPKRSRKAKIIVDDFYSGTLFDFITEEPALLIAKNGFYGQKEIGENLISKLQKANIPVVEINDKERRFLESSLKTHNSSITDDFHLYGYAENGKIYISPFGINPETVIHEYTHLWGECIKASNPELFERIKKEVLATDEFKQMLRNDAYETIKSNEDAMCLEVLAVLSGDENTERLETLLNPQNGNISDSDKKIEEALSTTWKFTDEMLFSHHSHNLTLKEITSHILDDAFNSVSLEDVKRKYKFQYSELFDKNEEFTFDTDKALKQGYAALSNELLNQYFSLRPYMSDETKQHYKDWLSSSIKNDGRQTSETLVRYIEEETISQKFFKRFINDYKDESVKNYIESIFEKNDSEDFASAFDSGFTLHSLNFYADRERNQTYLHFANFLHSEVLKEKNPVALNCLKQFISENNSPELIRFLMLSVGAKDQHSYENRMLIRSLLPNVEVKDENNRVHKEQQDFGILDSECFVTSKNYSSLFVGSPLDGKMSKLSLDEKAISLSEEFKKAFSDIDVKRIENSIKDKPALDIKSNLSYFDKRSRDKALLKGDMEKLKKVESHIREKLATYTYGISNETEFSVESEDSFTNIKDGSLTIPSEILSDFSNIAKNAIKVKTSISESGSIETLYSSPIKYKDKEYDFTFTLTNENGENILKEKSLNLSIRDKKKHSLISEEDYLDKDTGEIKSEFIKEIMSGGKSLHEIEHERYIDSLYLTRSINRDIFEGLRKEYLEEKGLAYEPLKDDPTSLLYDESEEKVDAEEEQKFDTEESTIETTKNTVAPKDAETSVETEPKIVLNDKENIKEEKTISNDQISTSASALADDFMNDYSTDETDDIEYISDDDFDYSTPSPTPDELKEAFYEEYNKAIAEDAAFSLVKERQEKEAAWAEEKRLAQEEGKKQAVRYYEISKNCSIPLNNPYLLSHGLDASIAEKNGVHYNMKYRQLQIPLYSNKNGELCNIQRIYDDGRKYNLKGAEVGHAVIGEPTLENLVFICEGWATGAAIHKATGARVFCSMSCINYKRVMDFIRKENSDALVVAIADRNPPQLGEKYGVGEKYARESGADVTLVIPDTGDPSIKDAADFAKVYDLKDYITNMLVLQKEVITKNDREEKISSSLTIKPRF